MSRPITRTQLEALVCKEEFDSIVDQVMQAGHKGQYVTVREKKRASGRLAVMMPASAWRLAETGNPRWHYVPAAEWLRT